ncbi:MAG: hypothetical protein QXV52_03260 [Nitrososphaeria archaeon]
MSKIKRLHIKIVLGKYFVELEILQDAYISSRCLLKEFMKEKAEMLLKVFQEVIENF